MGQVASEVLAGALADGDRTPEPDFAWRTADLGLPTVDLQDKDAVRRALGDQR